MVYGGCYEKLHVFHIVTFLYNLIYFLKNNEILHVSHYMFEVDLLCNENNKTEHPVEVEVGPMASRVMNKISSKLNFLYRKQ